MEKHIVKVKATEWLTHDVYRVQFEKPENYTFIPGQATEVAINKEGWTDKKRPFTFTSLNDDKDLELVIKVYEDHHGVTEQVGKLEVGDEIIIHDVWGAIQYKGPGVFLAGGSGITPFIAIFKELEQEGKLDGNKLLFANKTTEDIILKSQFEQWLGDDFINILSDEENDSYAHGYITQDFLKENIQDFNQNFYICGPRPMVKAMQEYLVALGAADGVITVEV